DILSVGIFLVDLQKSAVLSADADGAHTKTLYQLYQALIYAAQHHLRHFHRVRIRHTQTVDKFRLHSYFTDPLADLLAAAMNDDRLETVKFQKCHILNNTLL